MTVSAPRESRGSLDPELPALLPGLLRTDREDGDGPADVRRSARDRVVDALGFLIAAAIGLLADDTAMLHDPAEIVQLIDLVVGGLACVALWWRRRCCPWSSPAVPARPSSCCSRSPCTGVSSSRASSPQCILLAG